MNSIPFISTLLLCTALHVSGQGLYLGAGGGYGFPVLKQSILEGQYFQPDGFSFGVNDQVTTTTAANGNSTSVEHITRNTFSFGKGFNPGVYGGYMFTRHIGAELGISYLLGTSSKSTLEDDITSTAPWTASYETNTSVTTIKGSMLRLVPGIRLQCGENKLHPYLSAGLIVGVAGKFTSERLVSNTSTLVSPQTNDDIWTYSGGLSLGFHGALGATYMFTDKLGVFAECSGNFQNYSPKKAERTTSTTNGVNNLPSMNTNQKEVTYSPDFSGDYQNQPTGSPTQKIAVYFPFSSLGFNIGVHYAFGK